MCLCIATGVSVEMAQSKIQSVLSTLNESHHVGITTEYNVRIMLCCVYVYMCRGLGA